MPDRLSELAEALANPIKYQSELDKREHQLSVLTEDTDVPTTEAKKTNEVEKTDRPVAHPVSTHLTRPP